MKSLFKNLSRENKELIWRLILCTIISTGFSWLIGEPYSPTAAVTANLFLYLDRGYRGSLRYGTRRVLVQIIQGLFVLVLIFPCKYFKIPVPDPILIILSCIFAIVIGLPINMRYTYTPVLSTLANATFIIACGTVQNFTRFPYRVLECVGGYAIGYIVYYFLIPSQERYPKTKNSLKNCSDILLKNGTSAAYRKAKKTLDNDMQFLTEDNEGGLKKYHIDENDLRFLRAFKKTIEAIEVYQDHLNHYKAEIDPEFFDKYQKEFHATQDFYDKYLQDFAESRDLPDALPDEISSSPVFNPSNDGELLLSSDIIDFRERMRILIAIDNNVYEANPAES